MSLDDIHLRDVTVADLDILFEYGRDPDAVRMAAFTHKDPSDRRAFDAHWARLFADASIRKRAIIAGGRVVGSVASFVHDGVREVTYWIGREHWGKGLATKALAALLREDTHRPLLARVAKDNLGSRCVLEKCGFRIIGEGKWFANARGAEIDELVLRLDGPVRRDPGTPLVGGRPPGNR
jgi:RimJ/RimL family protein N-acetyltransferase